MRLLISIALFTALPGAAATPRTMRLDYYHTGDATSEIFSLDEVIVEGAWPGPLDRVVDDTNLGKYFFEVIDRKTNRVLYSRGFASIYGEWETTEEAKTQAKTFSESLRFPAPDAAVTIALFKRDDENAFVPVWTTTVDPKSMFVDT